MTGPTGVNWVLLDGRTLASSRFQGYAVHDFLIRRDLRSHVLSTPPFPLHDVPWRSHDLAVVAEATAGEIVVLQKVRGPRTDELLRALVAAKAHVVYAAADLEPENDLPLRCDVTACSSPLLADFWRDAGANAAYVPEPADFWCDVEELGRVRSPRDRMRLCWIGHRKNWGTLERLRRLLADPAFARLELVTVSDHVEADVQWSLEAARRELLAADVGVVPAGDRELARYASANRVVQVLAAGKPVVADRVPSYEDLVIEGSNGFLCESDEDWRAALLALADPRRRAELGAQGWHSVRPRFHVDAVGERWLELFPPLTAGRGLRRLPRVRALAHAGLAAEALERDLGLPTVAREAVASLRAPSAAPAALGVTARAAVRAVWRRVRRRQPPMR